MKNVFFFLAMVIIMASCSDDPGLSVEEYIMDNNLVTQELDRGVHIVIHEEGNNVKPNINSAIRINYEGKLTNGNVFDSGDNVVFQLKNLIEGWRIGLKEIGKGGSCTLIIPPASGYGSSEVGSIPANSTLVFNIDLLDVN